MAPKQPPAILPPNLTLEKLVSVQQLLHLTVHRNKNQHRIAKWWGNLQLLRRNVKRLVDMLQSPEAEYRKSKEAMLKMCQWMETEIIPRTYLSFSAVVADNQYASLGLMLMGCLARVNACISFPGSRLPSDDEEEVTVEASGRTVVPSEDFGEAITREEEKLEEMVLEEAREKGKGKLKKGKPRVLGESALRNVSETEPKPVKSSLKREVLDVEGSSEEEQRKPAKKVKKAKKVSRKFLEEFDHLSGNSSSEEEPVPKKARKVAAAPPEAKPIQTNTSESEENAKPMLKKVKKVASSTKAGKPLKKKKKKGGDDFDDLFAGLM